MDNLPRHWIAIVGALPAEDAFVRLLASSRFSAVLVAAAAAVASLASLASMTGCSGAPDATIGPDPVAEATDAGAATTSPILTNADAGSAASGDDDASTDTDASTGAGAKDYSSTDAVTYAAAHWDDGVGECAEFVSHCLIAGHLDIPVITWVPTLLAQLDTLGLAFDEHGESGSASASVGDVVIFSNASGASFCDDHDNDEGNCGHTCIVTVAGDSASTTKVDCHNNAHHEMAVTDFFGSEFSRYRVYHLGN